MSNPATPTPPAPAARPARFLHALTLTALALALGFLGLLAVLTTAPVIRESLGPLVSAHQVASGVAIFVTLALAIFLPLVALIFCSRRGWLRGPRLAVPTASVLAAFAWLMWDEPAVRRPLTMDELSPSLPGDEVTFQLVMRYAKNTPAANAVKPLKLALGAATADIVPHPEKWAQFLRAHRTEIEAEWAALAPVRAWWDELAAQPRLGDLTAPSPSAPIIAFQPVRAYSQVAVAIAGLQAHDGHGDEALATITRLYDVARKLEPNSRTLVRSMIAKVLQKMALQSAGFVLDRAAVAPAARAALAAELSAAAGGPPGARRLILIEYAHFAPALTFYLSGAPAMESAAQRALQRVVHLLGRVVVNPIATQNLVGDRYYALAALAEARRLADLETAKGEINREFLGGYHVKNLGGRLFADLAVPALSKVVKTYWDIEDLRAALLTRLKT